MEFTDRGEEHVRESQLYQARDRVTAPALFAALLGGMLLAAGVFLPTLLRAR